jgi:hypothetical protein
MDGLPRRAALLMREMQCTTCAHHDGALIMMQYAMMMSALLGTVILALSHRALLVANTPFLVRAIGALFCSSLCVTRWLNYYK